MASVELTEEQVKIIANVGRGLPDHILAPLVLEVALRRMAVVPPVQPKPAEPKPGTIREALITALRLRGEMTRSELRTAAWLLLDRKYPGASVDSSISALLKSGEIQRHGDRGHQRYTATGA